MKLKQEEVSLLKSRMTDVESEKVAGLEIFKGGVKRLKKIWIFYKILKNILSEFYILSPCQGVGKNIKKRVCSVQVGEKQL